GVGQVKLRLVHAYQTDYVEEGEHFDHVWRFADKGDGYMDEIHPLRDKYRADVAVLIVDDPKGCGLATRVYADAEEAFAVVHHECAVASYSVAHEIGHLIGARHDLNMDRNMTPFPYGHGYVNGTKWRGIMSYRESCGGCPRLPVWSSPRVTIKGEVAGTLDLDNARVIAEQAARGAAIRELGGDLDQLPPWAGRTTRVRSAVASRVSNSNPSDARGIAGCIRWRSPNLQREPRSRLGRRVAKSQGRQPVDLALQLAISECSSPPKTPPRARIKSSSPCS